MDLFSVVLSVCDFYSQRFLFRLVDLGGVVVCLLVNVLLTLTLDTGMEVVNPRSALLSNFEVLALLRELDTDHVARTKTAIRIKKEEDVTGKPTLETHSEEVSENLRTVELEVRPRSVRVTSPLDAPPRQYSTSPQSTSPRQNSPIMAYLSSSATLHAYPSQKQRNSR